MACMKLGSKMDTFQRHGQAWFCTTGLPSDVTVDVSEITFHLHKFPLLSKSCLLEKLIGEKSDEEESCVIKLPDIPGGSKAFKLVAKFCYGVKIELTASNVVYAQCAAAYLQMTEEVAERNLIFECEGFLNHVIINSWKDSVRTLQACVDLLPYAEELNIVKRCIDSLAVKIMEHISIQSPGGSALWNGISTGLRSRKLSSDWWYEEVSSLNLLLFKRLISVVKSRGMGDEIIADSVAFYAKRCLPGLNRRHSAAPMMYTSALAEEQRGLLEEIESLLPIQKGMISTKFLFGFLRIALFLKASPACLSNLEKRIGMQFDDASLEDLLMPTFSYSMETLYDIDCVQRILMHFLVTDQATGAASPGTIDDDQLMGSPSLTPITNVAKLIDGYMAEVAPDVNLNPQKFQALASAIPEYARPLEDSLYRAIDIYLKAHPWLQESDREQLCRLMDCQKLSLEACTHAAQNERLPLRIVVQVLFFEQLQLRTSIAGCFLVSENLDGSRLLRSGHATAAPSDGGGWTTAVKENHVLKVGMDHMRVRVSELEKECLTMRQEIERLGQMRNSWGSASKKLGFKIRSQICSTQEDSVNWRQKRGNIEALNKFI